MVKRLLGWVLASLLLGAVAGPGCGTDAVAVDACRQIEYARCEQGPQCPGLNVSDVDACKRFYRDQCLHGLMLDGDPGEVVVNRCVADMRQAGSCPDQSCIAGTASLGCQIVEQPQLAPNCAFLVPVPIPVAGTSGAAGTAGAAGSAGAAGTAGTAGTGS